MPQAGAWLSAAPSPAAGDVMLSFYLPEKTETAIFIYDAQGRKVREWVGGPKRAGQYRILWEGRDQSGHRVPSGVYFARLELPKGQLVRKIVLTE